MQDETGEQTFDTFADSSVRGAEGSAAAGARETRRRAARRKGDVSIAGWRERAVAGQMNAACDPGTEMAKCFATTLLFSNIPLHEFYDHLIDK